MRAGRAGQGAAEAELVGRYYVGEGLPQDDAEAVGWTAVGASRATLRRSTAWASCSCAAGASAATMRPRPVGTGRRPSTAAPGPGRAQLALCQGAGVDEVGPCQPVDRAGVAGQPRRRRLAPLRPPAGRVGGGADCRADRGGSPARASGRRRPLR